MSKTLKVMDDGSEFTTNHVAVIGVGGIIFSALMAYGMCRWDMRKNRKSKTKEIPGMFK